MIAGLVLGLSIGGILGFVLGNLTGYAVGRWFTPPEREKLQ